MNNLRQEFVDLKPADKIASISLVVTILVFIATSISVSLAYLGYSISSAVEERNKHDWSIVQANNLKSFWGDIESVENNIIQQVAVVALLGGELHRHDVRPCPRLGHGQCADMLARDQTRQVLRLLRV